MQIYYRTILIKCVSHDFFWFDVAYDEYSQRDVDEEGVSILLIDLKDGDFMFAKAHSDKLEVEKDEN